MADTCCDNPGNYTDDDYEPIFPELCECECHVPEEWEL